jgi:hypothetical protein
VETLTKSLTQTFLMLKSSVKIYLTISLFTFSYSTTSSIAIHWSCITISADCFHIWINCLCCHMAGPFFHNITF